MKTLSRIIIAGTLSLSMSANAGREGGGGAGSAISFQKRALEFIKDLRDNPKYKKLNSLGLDATLDGAHFLVVKEPQPVVKYGYIQDSDATNHKKGTLDKEQPDLIILYNTGWDKIAAQDSLIGKTLACHELVSLKGAEETAVYDLCRGYLAGQMGLPLDGDGRVKVAPPQTQLEAQLTNAADETAKRRREVFQKVEKRISEAVLANLEVYILNMQNINVKRSTMKVVDSQVTVSGSVLRDTENPKDANKLPVEVIAKGAWTTDKDIEGKVLMQGTAIIRTSARSKEMFHDPTEHAVNMVYRIPFKLALQTNLALPHGSVRAYDSYYMTLISGKVEETNLDTKEHSDDAETVLIDNSYLWDRLGAYYNDGKVHDAYAADLTFLSRHMIQPLLGSDNVVQLNRALQLVEDETAAMKAQVEIAKAHVQEAEADRERFDDPKNEDKSGTDTLYGADLHRDLKAQSWDKFIAMLKGPNYVDTTGGGLHKYLRAGLARFEEINKLQIRDEYQYMNFVGYPVSGIESEAVQANKLEGDTRVLFITVAGPRYQKQIVVSLAQMYDPKAKQSYSALVISGWGTDYGAKSRGDRLLVFKPVVASLYNYGSAVSLTDLSCSYLNSWGYGENKTYCNYKELSGRDD